MARATTGKVHQKRKRKILKDTKGYYGARSSLFRTAKDARRRALQNSYKNRRMKKREFRVLWIVRISAAAKLCGTSYNKLISGLKANSIALNRKMLAEIAVKDMETFKKIVEKAKAQAA
ncbi:MAG TPA: 50S ribosomal protein L20 [Spirochaetota bacterium]|nr:50S ribosomal protein L20 [Spirochaetota bacterium]HPI89666.1 50S ribosomal protein L20 [Spirochaetota bacterium]HPR49508.1 50S ribosomal protein L20 [Spirochaetota bacterium]